jgi:hypothetical protein
VDGFTFVEIFFQSGSGDWGQFADLCYRSDGTLARLIDMLNTFNAGDADEEEEGESAASTRSTSTRKGACCVAVPLSAI